mmetsp:Transcript_14663/g.32171  ORF Transcript_14663/g.32171 Transcript_14663/m.32171 type:complete len:255 (-) Transcript_14663:313-1077(-)
MPFLSPAMPVFARLCGSKKQFEGKRGITPGVSSETQNQIAGSKALNGENSVDLHHLIAKILDNIPFPATVADPQSQDCPLIGASPDFVSLTQFPTTAILGRNCRFLNEGCHLSVSDRQDIRTCVKTGKHFTGVLANQRADGTHFLNLLDMRGLKIGKYAETGEEKWLVIAVQGDVSNLETAEIPFEHIELMEEVAKAIAETLAKVTKNITVRHCNVPSKCDDFNESTEMPELFEPYSEPIWIPGEVRELALIGA